MISKGNPTYFFERDRSGRSLERDKLRIVSISTIFNLDIINRCHMKFS